MAEAVRRLNENEVVGIPTETVYGLAGRIGSEEAIRKIFSTKERPFFDPLIVHVASIAQAKSLTQDWPPIAEVLARNFWPGPLTLVLRKNEKVNDLISSGLETVGIRMPKHPMTLNIIEQVGPLAAPSANKFGKTSPTTASHVHEEFQLEKVFVVDGGACQIGLESTVLLVDSGNRLSILREGAITRSQIESVVQNAGLNCEFYQAEKSASPGHMKHHYMPKVPFVLFHERPRDMQSIKIELMKKIAALPEVVEGIRLVKPSAIEHLAELKLAHEPTIAAREFYAKLRELSNQNPDLIYFVVPKEFQSESWLALQDRMNKAASFTF